MRSVILCAVWLTGCSDFALPSALSRSQVLAVRSTPAAIPPGERGVLDALIAGPDGAVDAELTWSLGRELPGCAIERDASGITWLAVAADQAPADAIVALRVVTPDGDELLAEKTVEVGGDRHDNPVLVEITADGVPVDGELGLGVDEVASLAAAGTPRVNWYATIGEIELYRRNPAEIVAPDAPGTGWLFVVGRDDVGGVTWADAAIVVD